jgi:competence protein ComEC
VAEDDFLDIPSRIEGRLRREPDVGVDHDILILDTDSLRVRGAVHRWKRGIRARVSGDLRERLRGLEASDRVALWGRLHRPSSFGNDGGFDVERYFERERLDLSASVKSALLVERTARASGLRAAISRIRNVARRRLESALVDRSRDTYGVVLALVTGDRLMLSRDLEDLYRDAGIFHVMAISGAQVAIVALVFYFALRRVGASEVASLWILLLVLPLYAAFCGSGPPVVRAALAASLILCARLLSLDRPHANALALAALFLLVWEPLWLEDPGFQLSFAAMAGILWLSEPLAERLRALGPLSTPLAVSLGAQAMVVPITAWHFHGLTWVAPLASLLAVPLSGVVVVAGLALVVLADVPLVSDALSLGAHAGVYLLTSTARLASALPGASLAVARPSVLWMVSFYGAIALVRHGTARLRLAGLLLACGLLGALPFGRGEETGEPGTVAATALDVGHGDSIVLSLPEGGRVLVDGGGTPATSFDVGERVVVPYLLDHGGRRVDVLALTHADYDHIGGLIAVVEALSVGEIWEGEARWDRPAYRRLREAARRRGVPIRRLRPGERFLLGGAGFEVLAASGTSGEPPPEEENDRSVVLRVTWGGSALLLTGDAGEKVESALLSSRTPLEADVLKVGHHGSESSTSRPFLDAVRPRFAIVSAREREGWPLPSERVLERLEAEGIPYARTDRDGAVTVRLDAQGGMEVSTYRGTKR